MHHQRFQLLELKIFLFQILLLFETAADKPRALKEDVGFKLSSLINNLLIPRSKARFFAFNMGKILRPEK